MSRIFDPPPDRPQWDYVFNCGGETALSQTHEIYKIRSYNLSMVLGREAAKRNVKAFVECSTGMVYAPSRTPKKETDKLKPWLKLSKSKLQAEVDLSKIEGLNLIILRMPHVYGEYDSGFIARGLCLARVYQHQNRELKWLWTSELRINTVHVHDAARALWTAAEYRSKLPPSTSTDSSIPSSRRPSLSQSSGDNASPLPGTPIFNIVDHGSTTQGTLAGIISEVFSIKTGFQGSLISSFAKLNLDHVVDDLNEDILSPWAEMLQEKKIERPGPITPFMEKELLKDQDLSLDGGKFERETGFKYQRPEGLTKEGIREILGSYQRMGWWP